MNQTIMQAQIEELNRKMDVILEEIELQRRHRREMDDLKEDLMRVGKDVYQTAIQELEDVHDHMNSGDALFLAKKLLRNINTMTAMFEQLESMRDFLKDFGPISRELGNDVMNILDEFDRKGYFSFMKEMTSVMDRIVTSFSVEDVKSLGDNVVTILNTIKSLTQPDMLQTVNNAVNVYKKLDIEVHDDVSLMRLLKDLNTPEARKGLAFAVQFLKSLAAPQVETNPLLQPTSTN